MGASENLKVGGKLPDSIGRRRTRRALPPPRLFRLVIRYARRTGRVPPGTDIPQELRPSARRQGLIASAGTARSWTCVGRSWGASTRGTTSSLSNSPGRPAAALAPPAA